MELRQLEHVVAAADEGQFTRAAARCHIAQSGLSLSVRALERELGADLFVREARRVTLTEAGAAFVEEARHAMASIAAAKRAVGDVCGLERGSLSIGTVHAASYWFDLAAAVAGFHRLYPRIEITTRTGDADHLLNAVSSGALDVAVCGLPSEVPESLVASPVIAVPFGAYLPSGHRFGSRRKLSAADLEHEELIRLPVGNMAREAADRAFAMSGIRPAVRFEAGDAQMALRFVAQGLGVACLPSLPELPPGTAFVRLSGWAPWTLALMRASSMRATHAARAFCELFGGGDDPQASPSTVG